MHVNHGGPYAFGGWLDTCFGVGTKGWFGVTDRLQDRQP
jgi:hypothetical protein